MQASLLREGGNDILGDRPLVEALASFLGNAAQGLRQLWVAEDLADRWRPALGQKHARGVRVVGDMGGAVGPFEGAAAMHGETLVRIADRRLQELVKRL